MPSDIPQQPVPKPSGDTPPDPLNTPTLLSPLLVIAAPLSIEPAPEELSYAPSSSAGACRVTKSRGQLHVDIAQPTDPSWRLKSSAAVVLVIALLLAKLVSLLPLTGLFYGLLVWAVGVVAIGLYWLLKVAPPQENNLLARVSFSVVGEDLLVDVHAQGEYFLWRCRRAKFVKAYATQPNSSLPKWPNGNTLSPASIVLFLREGTLFKVPLTIHHESAKQVAAEINDLLGVQPTPQST